MAISDAFWPFKIAAAIVVAYLVHEWLTDMIDNWPDDPDCPT